MVWRLISYTELYAPTEPYKSTYIIGIVENERGERRIVRIDRKYFGKLRIGVEGEVEERWSVFGNIPYFNPKIELEYRRVLFVTGGARGIGATIARFFAEQGFDVAIGDIVHDEEVEKNLEYIKNKGVNALFVKLDVSKEESVDQAVREIMSRLGRIDVLVNNAGIARDSYIHKMTLEKWNKVLEINLTGAYICSRKVLPYMIKQGGGVIVNISSIVGLLGNIGQANYASSKAGLIGLTYTLAKELAPYGIRVVAIAPGFARTRMALSVPKNILVDYIRRLPIPRLVEPLEIAKLVYHIVENDALNGIVIPIDLGTTIASPKA